MLSQEPGRCPTTRRGSARAWLALVLLVAALAVPSAAWAELLAVIDRSHPASAELNADQLSLLAQAVRGEAARHLAARDLAVLSEENTVSILRDMGVDLATCDGECEVEIARKLQADWLISSKVVRFGAQWTLQLNLFETATGRLAGSEQLAAKGEEDLVNGVPGAACRLLAGTWAPDSACAPLAKPAAAETSASSPLARRAVVRPQPAEPAPATPAPATVQPQQDTRGAATRCLGTTRAGARCRRMTTAPSGYCYQHVDQAPPGVQPPPGASDSARCQAITQRGTRCSRRATHNGYCWQHKR